MNIDGTDYSGTGYAMSPGNQIILIIVQSMFDAIAEISRFSFDKKKSVIERIAMRYAVCNAIVLR